MAILNEQALNLTERKRLDNLILNMTAGLLPEQLSWPEMELLEKGYGRNWFYDLGYNDKEYKNPCKQ